MNDKRTALPGGKKLVFTNREGGKTAYTIKKELARGGSSIVYDAVYVNNSGADKKVRIKECYPYRLNIIRDNNGFLHAKGAEESKFEEFKDKFKRAFDASNRLFNIDVLTNSVSNAIDIYDASNTVYIVSSYIQGDTVSEIGDIPLQKAVSIVKGAARAVSAIHKAGWLYLDIKPENVFVLGNTTEQIQLFDFDSLFPICENGAEDMSEYKISYTKGFAALELQMGELHKLGRHTDVFGIGALLFYMLFGRTPKAAERSAGAVYDYGSFAYAGINYRDSLYFLLTEFFHHTLPDYYADRYKDMETVVEKLSCLEKAADITVPYIYSAYKPDKKLIFGREGELARMEAWRRDKDSRCLIVSGMGGIGKSSLVRSYVWQNRERLGTILYLDFKNSIRQTITDDWQLSVNLTVRQGEESIDDYFLRKMKALRLIAADEEALLIIDNFIGELDEDVKMLAELGWKIILITRNECAAAPYDILKVGEIGDKKHIYEMFEHYLGRCLDGRELEYADIIIEKTGGHTLALELTARQLARSFLPLEEAAALAQKHGFSKISAEKVRFSKDYKEYYAAVENIIGALFETADMNDLKRSVLKALALFGTAGADVRGFARMSGIKSLDCVNELMEMGWISGDRGAGILSVHPIVAQVVQSWTADGINTAAFNAMESVCGKIHALAGAEEFSTRAKYLGYSENMIKAAQRDKALYCSPEYGRLLYETIIAMPLDREDFIEEWGSRLVNDASISGVGTRELMEAYDMLLTVYETKGNLRRAKGELVRIRSLAEKCRDGYITGQYYYMLSCFYDEALGGAYAAANGREEQYLQWLVKSLDRAVRYLKKSRTEDRTRLIQCLLSKASVLMRSRAGSKAQIERLLKGAAKLIGIHDEKDLYTYPPEMLLNHIEKSRCDEYSGQRRRNGSGYKVSHELIKDYYMVCAWYATLVLEDCGKTDRCVGLAYREMGGMHERADVCAAGKAGTVTLSDIRLAHKNLNIYDIDEINSIIIPYADMLCTLNEYGKSARVLGRGIEICDRHPQVVTYMRKRLDLTGYLLDVYYEAGELDKCREMVRDIERMNEEYREFGIKKAVPNDIVEELFGE